MEALISTFSDAVAMIRLIRSIYREMGQPRCIGALFNWRGMRLDGESWIQLDVIGDENSAEVWWFRAKPMEDFQFIRLPVNAGAVIEVLRHETRERHPSVEWFRYIVPPPPGHVYSGEPVPNVRCNFMVFAYRPKDLLKISFPG